VTVASPPLETPFFLTSAGTPVYAVLHAPAAPGPDPLLVVHCHSVGVEHVTLYRSEVRAARAAAAAGAFALRYHARGHGDSGGSTADVTFERLVEDALAAAAAGRERCGARRVAWAGARYGALVAAAAAARVPGAAGLALWEPAASGPDHFRGALRAYLFSLVAEGVRPGETVDDLLARVERDGWVDVRGYALHRALVASSAGLTLEALLPDPAPPALLVQIQSRPRLSPAHERLVAALEARGAMVRTACVPEEAAFHYMANPAWESAALAASHGEWVRGLA